MSSHLRKIPSLLYTDVENNFNMIKCWVGLLERLFEKRAFQVVDVGIRGRGGLGCRKSSATVHVTKMICDYDFVDDSQTFVMCENFLHISPTKSKSHFLAGCLFFSRNVETSFIPSRTFFIFSLLQAYILLVIFIRYVRFAVLHKSD